MKRFALLLAIFSTACVERASAEVVIANSREQLIALVKQAEPGTTIHLAPGEYRGGLHFTDLHGEEGKPITITGGNTDTLPTIKGGTNCIQISRSSHLVLERIQLEGATGNGLNIDDGGTIDKPAHHITLRGLTVRDVGPDGNRDGIKLSGVTDFELIDCILLDWGNGGSGIDMVGCHRGVIRSCALQRSNKGATGIQCKGGTSKIRVLRCRFDNAGMRHINLGGSTGRQYFRPRLDDKNNAEARDLEVAGCTFVGPGVPVAFVGVDGAKVHHNTMINVSPWALRILQETVGDDFVACRDGAFTDNLIVFEQSDLRRTVNIGPNTKPDTFTFERNWWYCKDAPGRSSPTLPTEETGGVYGRDPMLKANGAIREGSPAKQVGAHAWWGAD